MTTDPFTEAARAEAPEPCTHHWVSHGQDSTLIPWVIRCDLCGAFHIAEMERVARAHLAVEVRKAKAEALREAALDVSFIEIEDDYDRLDYSTSREFYEDMVQDWLRACAIAAETGDSDEHR